MANKQLPEARSQTQVSERGILSRREFLRNIAVGGGSMVLLAGCGVSAVNVKGSGYTRVYSFIAVDYSKCSGCRTCEAVCAAYNHPDYSAGNYRSDIGNPVLSNIRVHSFNPDVSAPVVCARCGDTPCVSACPVEQDALTGHRALYKKEPFGTIVNDTKRCISCGSCIEACAENGVGILSQNPETNKPIRMCTLCDGEPRCVEHCPYEALSILRVNGGYPFYRMSPETVAETLNKRWYL